MKVSHPRFLSIGNRDDMTKEFPACLQKMTNAEQSVAGGNFNKMPQAVFSFPEVGVKVLPVHFLLIHMNLASFHFAFLMPSIHLLL